MVEVTLTANNISGYALTANLKYYSIVLIHGLTGGQVFIWTAEGATAPRPQLLLSKDIPNAQISAFGYDADVVNLLAQTLQNIIWDHATDLSSDL